MVKILRSEYDELVAKANELPALQAEAARRRVLEQAEAVLEHATTLDGRPLEFTPLQRRGLLADLPTLAEGDRAGDLDREMFKRSINEAFREIGDRVSEATWPEPLTHNAWGRPLTEVQEPSPFGRDD